MSKFPKTVSDPLFRNPRDGRDGRNGADGKDGRDGVQGPPGADGVGMEFRGSWHRRVQYRRGDVVSHQGSAWVSKTDNSGQSPRLQSNHWNLLVPKGQRGERGPAGDRGPRGRAGESAEPAAIEVSFETPVLDGTPCYLTTAGLAVAAQSDSQPTADVVGLAKDGGLVSEGRINRPDWSGVAGSPVLTPGSRYFLSATTAGRITETAPTSEGHLVVPLGIAVSPYSLDIEVGQSVLL